MEEIKPLRVSDVAMTLIFRTMWIRMPNKSFITGLWLRAYMNTPLQNNCFLRVLPVEKYPYFRYLFANYVLCTPAEKAIYEQCTPESLIQYSLDIEEQSRGKNKADWDAVKLLEADLKELYKKHFPYTYRGMINYSYTLEQQKQIIGRLNKDF